MASGDQGWSILNPVLISEDGAEMDKRKLNTNKVDVLWVENADPLSEQTEPFLDCV